VVKPVPFKGQSQISFFNTHSKQADFVLHCSTRRFAYTGRKTIHQL